MKLMLLMWGLISAMVMFKFSGHETFPCRYSWLCKAVRALKKNPALFSDRDEAMIIMGVGKNMAQAIRFWTELAGMCHISPGQGYLVTPLGEAIFGEQGLDPFLEDRQTLWLIHWKFTTYPNPAFAWDFLFNRWQAPDMTASAVFRAFEREAQALEKNLSSVTLKQHFEVFKNTYHPTRGTKGKIAEENLDSPLTELNLLQVVGERRNPANKLETVYAFRREAKSDISPLLFLYCLVDFWNARHLHEDTLSFREIAVGHGSPGQVFKMPEEEIRQRLDDLKGYSKGAFDYRESANLQRVIKEREVDALSILRDCYADTFIYA